MNYGSGVSGYRNSGTLDKAFGAFGISSGSTTGNFPHTLTTTDSNAVYMSASSLTGNSLIN